MSPSNESTPYTPDMNEIDTNEGEDITFPRLHNGINIGQYFEQEPISIENSGAICDVKPINNIRVLSINPNGCAPKNQTKMVMLKEAISKY